MTQSIFPTADPAHVASLLEYVRLDYPHDLYDIIARGDNLTLDEAAEAAGPLPCGPAIAERWDTQPWVPLYLIGAPTEGGNEIVSMTYPQLVVPHITRDNDIDTLEVQIVPAFVHDFLSAAVTNHSDYHVIGPHEPLLTWPAYPTDDDILDAITRPLGGRDSLTLNDQPAPRRIREAYRTIVTHQGTDALEDLVDLLHATDSAPTGDLFTTRMNDIVSYATALTAATAP